MEIRALVFDLAGVLLDFGGPESVHAMSNGRVDERAFFRFWSEAKCAHDLHCGRCSPEDFAREAVREFKLNVTPETFLDDYKTWFRGLDEGALELLEGAVAVGMHGHCVRGFGDLRILLGRMGFLDGRT